MPTKTMTGGYITGTSTNQTWDDIKTTTFPKTAEPVPASVDGMFEINASAVTSTNGAGGINNYTELKAWLAFKTSDITVAPASAVLNLSVKVHVSGPPTFTNLDSDHAIAVVAPQTASGKMGFPGAFFDSNGASNQTSVSTIRPANDDIEGFGNGDVSSAVTYYSTPTVIVDKFGLGGLANGDALTITLNATARAAMASQDVFVICIVDNNFTIEGVDPNAGGQESKMVFSFADGSDLDGGIFFAPFIDYTEEDTSDSTTLVGDDFTINTFSSAVLGAQHTKTGDQVPFSLGTPGARFLRGRPTAYAAEKGESVKDKDGSGKKGKKKKDE